MKGFPSPFQCLNRLCGFCDIAMAALMVSVSFSAFQCLNRLCGFCDLREELKAIQKALSQGFSALTGFVDSATVYGW